MDLGTIHIYKCIHIVRVPLVKELYGSPSDKISDVIEQYRTYHVKVNGEIIYLLTFLKYSELLTEKIKGNIFYSVVSYKTARTLLSYEIKNSP